MKIQEAKCINKYLLTLNKDRYIFELSTDLKGDQDQLVVKFAQTESNICTRCQWPLYILTECIQFVLWYNCVFSLYMKILRLNSISSIGFHLSQPRVEAPEERPTHFKSPLKTVTTICTVKDFPPFQEKTIFVMGSVLN